jgi:hypothetical protein
VERLGDGLLLTVHLLDEPQTDQAAIQVVENPKFIQRGTCVGYYRNPGIREHTMPDGSRLTLVARTPTTRAKDNISLVFSQTAPVVISLPDSEEVVCVELSADFRRMLVLSNYAIRIYDVENLRRSGVVDRSEINMMKAPDLRLSAFFVGQTYDVITPHSNGEIVRWSVSKNGAPATRQVIYRSRYDVIYAEPDEDGGRLIIIESRHGGDVAGLLYSIQARELWRELGAAYKWLGVAFVGKDQIAVYTNQWELQRSPNLAELRTIAEDLLPSYCREGMRTKDYVKSKCWPSDIRF